MKQKGAKEITYEQRLKLKGLLDSGNSRPEIAEALGICVCSVYKELKRGTLNGTYDPEYAQKVTPSRQMLENNPELADRIAAMILDEHLSPNKIIERFKQEGLVNGNYPLSNRTIYTAIDRGLIPNVTRDTLNAHTVTMCSKTLRLPLWFKNKLGLRDGDIFRFESNSAWQIILTKIGNRSEVSE